MKRTFCLNHKDVILLLIGSFFLLGSINARAQLNPADHTDPSAGVLLLQNPAGGEQLPGTQLDTKVSMRIRGIVAEVDVVQRFTNQTSEWMEATYAFPLPELAAVNRMEMAIGARRIEGEIKEKQQAQAIYKAAMKSGQAASLVSQQRPNLFTTKAANIAPGEAITVNIGYVQELDYRDGQFSIRFPMTVEPRSDDQSAQTTAALATVEALGFIAEPKQTAEPTASIQVDLQPGFDLARLESRYHDIDIDLDSPSNEYRIQFAAGAVPMARDFELIWEPTLRDAPQATVLTERYADEDYALVMLLPPREELPIQQPRELILVIDTSGSMHGASLRQAKASLRMALGTLRSQDRFNLIQFNSDHEALFIKPTRADDQAIGKADEYLDTLVANGGTEMAPALQAALDNPSNGDHIKQVVFVTDGAIGNETALFRLIEQHLGQARLFTVGIGSAPNSYFMRKAAEFGRGSAVLIGDTSAVAEKMDQLLTRLEHPAITDLEAAWSSVAEGYPALIPDLYLSEALFVTAKINGSLGNMTLHGRLGGASWQDELSLRQHARDGQGIATLWARRKVSTLMDDLALGADREQIRGHVLETALRYALVTQFTSFVAVDKTPVRSQESRLQRQRISGLAPSAIDLPQTATASLLHLVFGALVMLLGLAFMNRLHDDR